MFASKFQIKDKIWDWIGNLLKFLHFCFKSSEEEFFFNYWKIFISRPFCNFLCFKNVKNKSIKKLTIIFANSSDARFNNFYIKHKRQSFIIFPNTEKRVENTTRSGVFLTKFELFGNVMKHCLECLIYLLNQN
mgnify:CR=1 FL=1